MSSGIAADPMHSWAVGELARVLREELERVNLRRSATKKMKMKDICF